MKSNIVSESLKMCVCKTVVITMVGKKAESEIDRVPVPG
jgi:hypothetical protein